jgi:hypothetical protein
MSALLKDWNQAVFAADSDIPEDVLAELDPSAYNRLIARKALKIEQEQAAEFEDHRLKVKAEERERQEAAQFEEALIRAEQWDHTMIDYGGRQISQGDAHKADGYIVDHPDEMIEWGVKTGLFKSDAEGRHVLDLKRQVYELDEVEAQGGKLSSDQKTDRAHAREELRPYSALEAHGFDAWQQKKASNEIASPAASQTVLAEPLTVAVTNDDHPFRSRTPDMKASFAMQAGLPGAPQIQPEQEIVNPTPVTVRPLAMAGLS